MNLTLLIILQESLADEARMKSKYENDTEVAKSQRDYEVRQAGYDLEVQTKSAQSKLAYDLQAAITKQKIKEEEMQILVVERAQQIKVQEQVLKHLRV